MSKEKKSDAKKHPKKRGTGLKVLTIILSVILALEVLYCLAIFTDIPFIAHWREVYIQTALSTRTHQWLARYFIPKDIVDEVDAKIQQAKKNQLELEDSTWEADVTPNDVNGNSSVIHVNGNQQFTQPENPDRVLSAAEKTFFDLFWEVDQESMFSYLDSHPNALANGWEHIFINEAGLDDEGTSIKTIMGEQVLAVDVDNQILLIRITGSGYRGVLAVAKDPSLLRCCAAKNIGSFGEKIGSIAARNEGVLAISASGFDDPDGSGNGGTIAGASMCNGKTYGSHLGGAYKRIELHEDNRLYIKNASSYYSDDTTDASEFWPALVINGENVLGADTIFVDMNPRACLGQTSRGEILMLMIEGRLVTSIGTDAAECVDILMRHDAYQAMNLDGGTTAMLWYNGEYITRCSNTALSEGRYVPNAWVYG